MASVPLCPAFVIAMFSLTACVVGPAQSLRLIEVSVPAKPTRGSTVRLECHYDLQRDTLYKVKWYKDDNEFYRYTPDDRPANMAFRVQGISVDLAGSSSSSVVLENVQRSASGAYRCEVSSGAPSFDTVSKEKMMDVMESPLKMEQPPIGVLGGSVRLDCPHDLGDIPMYSFQWYKDDTEFYRFRPRTRPPAQTFTVEGVTLNVPLSNYSSMYLENLRPSSAGTYRCEVRSDAPHFLIVQDQKQLVVSELPEIRPHIFLDRESYKVGDTVHLNCTTSRSRPTPKLTLLVNDRPVDDASTRATIDNHADDFQSANLQFSFPVTHQNSRGGAVRVKCQANITDIYTATGETSIPVGQRTGPLIMRPQQRPQLPRLQHASSISPPKDECLAKAMAILSKAWATFQ
ncbi:basal cell adhesion molecule-like [Haemaphysalis longicornis]